MINDGNFVVDTNYPLADFEREPLKLELLKLTDADTKYMNEITALDIFEKGTHMFHPRGLYSTEIFGNKGSKERASTFGYIDLKNPIIHPLAIEALDDLRKNFYVGIMASNTFVKWNDETKNFDPSKDDDAQTGYQLFFSKLPKINFQKNNSDKRNVTIDLLQRYMPVLDMRYHIVMPAAYRDMDINEDNGQRIDNEINDLYRRLLAAANVMSVTEYPEAFDIPRWTAQKTAREIFDTIMRLIKGKRGALQKKYARRTTRNGTRNVVTALDTSHHYLDSESNVSLKDTKMSFVQALFGALPQTLRGLRLGILEEVFPTNMEGDEVWLVNTKTLKRELVTLDTEVVDKYATKEGRKKLLKRFSIKKTMNKPLIIEGYYLALMYEDDNSFKIFRDIDDLPDNFDRKKVTPLTLGDLLYTSAYPQWDDLWGTMTRYPITGDGSIFPTQFKITTTVTSYRKYQLDDNWEKDVLFHEFPERTLDAIWLNALSPHLSRLDDAGADFDGDQFASPILYLQESKDAMKKYYNSRNAYIRLDGRFAASAENKSNKLVAFNLTRDAVFSRHENEQNYDYFK